MRSKLNKDIAPTLPGKRQLCKAAKDGAAGIIRALDISQLLGDELADQIIGDPELEGYVELQRDLIAERIVKC